MAQHRQIKLDDMRKSSETLRAILDEIRASGARVTLTFPYGGTPMVFPVVLFANIVRTDDRFFFLQFGEEGFWRGNVRGLRLVKAVNWGTDDPPFDLTVMDVDGRQFVFSVLEPIQDPEHAARFTEWLAWRADHPQDAEILDARARERGVRFADEWEDDY